ncbi:rCG28831 [Rattus norvegicus]|uniref:RCG28831 n=1 Tax=Rattus norvegicus TaxID=10116 RepID=A6HUS0_RAT|nr:rCG28831 [Rattus norvegicus]
MKMASHLGTFNFRAIIVFTATSKQNGGFSVYDFIRLMESQTVNTEYVYYFTRLHSSLSKYA